MKIVLLLLFTTILLGCGTAFTRSFTRSPAEKSVDPEVIEAVAHADTENSRAKDTSRLVWIGSLAVISGVAIRFASNQFLPKSTGIGIGIAAGGASCLAIARFDASLQKVALPSIITILCLAGVWIAFRIYIYISTKIASRKASRP